MQIRGAAEAPPLLRRPGHALEMLMWPVARMGVGKTKILLTVLDQHFYECFGQLTASSSIDKT